MDLALAIALLCLTPGGDNSALITGSQVSCQHYYVKCMSGRVDEKTLLECVEKRMQGELIEEKVK